MRATTSNNLISSILLTPLWTETCSEARKIFFLPDYPCRSHVRTREHDSFSSLDFQVDYKPSPEWCWFLFYCDHIGQQYSCQYQLTQALGVTLRKSKFLQKRPCLMFSFRMSWIQTIVTQLGDVDNCILCIRQSHAYFLTSAPRRAALRYRRRLPQASGRAAGRAIRRRGQRPGRSVDRARVLCLSRRVELFRA
jgi:hypothetical protein